jgi:hypothetical protein
LAIVIAVQSVKSILTEEECKSCKTLQAWLNREISEKDFWIEKYQELLEPKVHINNESEPSYEQMVPRMHSHVTLSSIKTQLEQMSRTKSKVATDMEMTEGEKQFQTSLSSVSKRS